MSGHSKWSTIKRKKGANDARRGKLFTKLIRELTVAAREGGAVEESNPRLRTAVQNARAANMPQSTIDRAIRRGSGDEAGKGPQPPCQSKPGESAEPRFQGGGAPAHPSRGQGAARPVDSLNVNILQIVGDVAGRGDEGGGEGGQQNRGGWPAHTGGEGADIDGQGGDQAVERPGQNENGIKGGFQASSKRGCID